MCKIKEQKKIRIIGDYDIDGVNASYILLRDCVAVMLMQMWRFRTG